MSFKSLVGRAGVDQTDWRRQGKQPELFLGSFSSSFLELHSHVRGDVDPHVLKLIWG